MLFIARFLFLFRCFLIRRDTIILCIHSCICPPDLIAVLFILAVWLTVCLCCSGNSEFSLSWPTHAHSHQAQSFFDFFQHTEQVLEPEPPPLGLFAPAGRKRHIKQKSQHTCRSWVWWFSAKWHAMAQMALTLSKHHHSSCVIRITVPFAAVVASFAAFSSSIAFSLASYSSFLAFHSFLLFRMPSSMGVICGWKRENSWEEKSQR